MPIKNIGLDDQEREDLKQLLYAKVKELDADSESKINNLRKKKWANRLDAIYNRIIKL